jgi:molybdopterin-guanine dinucleotide biosynthesis protein A
VEEVNTTFESERSARGPIGVALAGGRSRRLGRDKGALELIRDGVRYDFVSWTLERLHRVGVQVALAGGGASAPGRSRLEPGEGRVEPGEGRLERVDDGPGGGPAAGILGAARRWPERSLLVLACDLPLVPVALLERLLERFAAESADLVLADGGRGIEPLCAVYGVAALSALSEQVAQGRLAPRMLPGRDDLMVERVAAEPSWLLNVNTPAELARFRALEAEQPS